MATLHVVWDPSERIQGLTPGLKSATDARAAHIHVADDLDKLDIYELSRKLAELLLEQLV